MKIGKYVLVKESDLEEIYTEADMIERNYRKLAYEDLDENAKCKALAEVSINAIYIMSTIKYLLNK